MQLSKQEQHWLPWWGATGKFAMYKACLFNHHRIPVIEKTFESIAETRVRLLTDWSQNLWSFLEDASLYLDSKHESEFHQALSQLLARSPDLSELMIVDKSGLVLSSTHTQHQGLHLKEKTALQRGLTNPFLHGPYCDPWTLDAGPSSSTFHDEVTLMFYQPLSMTNGDRHSSNEDRHSNSGACYCLCARVPNDVLGDLIQREAGHIYSESGDNYLFMVDSVFNPQIKPGVALSRSRFEDNRFSHGENLKEGVHTQWGTVKVAQHTEFEIVFNDPATGQLHPGVRETIKNGSNLYVEYPGYSDYRHIPVIGKGVTFTMPGSLDRWGMMCESDLEEVYRHRSLGQTLTQKFLLSIVFAMFFPNLINHIWPMAEWQLIALDVVVALPTIIWFYLSTAGVMANQLQNMSGVMQMLAEGDGNLKQRLDVKHIREDETGDLARWTNSFIDSLENVISDLVTSSKEVNKVSQSMFRRSQQLLESSDVTATSITDMLKLVGQQSEEIVHANDTATEMNELMRATVESAEQDFKQASESAQAIKDIVQISAQKVEEVNSEMEKIGGIVDLISEITAQTNLLALNAAIEAARAGEHGRGFAVVADEVRNLASKTNDAATNIGNLMEVLSEQSAQAVEAMHQGITNVETNTTVIDENKQGDALQQSVSGLFGLIQEIARNTEEHRQTADEAQHTVLQLQEASLQLSRRTTLMHNALARLDQLTGRFDISKAS
ncbi:methyl-accepting chemotaxis protein [Vibrio nitrifigilis]|uniref:Methyl-accepting chemotaxis protein n=1 Tax=Vibrio nitrifigilis TaxID=2789781 RepID=A0ABS0GK16_9VIBR|nr:HAMP domain-containing methyl-accepting chemotaxis protein [Vibrio nitrifigilis]MBF9002767.1 methyl-accepting chemotaxis protein [Vibrio nitrifigilis]